MITKSIDTYRYFIKKVFLSKVHELSWTYINKYPTSYREKVIVLLNFYVKKAVMKLTFEILNKLFKLI